VVVNSRAAPEKGKPREESFYSDDSLETTLFTLVGKFD
jgi:hypothetical protein